MSIEVNGTTYHDGTPEAVINTLEYARQTRAYRQDHGSARVRIFYGDTETGRDWLEENDVTSFIGRSTGSSKIPLLLARKNSSGGPAILDHCIIRLILNGIELYRHPKYQFPVFTIKEVTDPATLAIGLTAAVHVNGELHAQFKTRAKAERWVSFMKGERSTK